MAKRSKRIEQRTIESVDTVRDNVVLRPKTDTQQLLINSIISSSITIVIGPAGCGKTYVSTTMAAKSYLSNQVKQIILSRANVPTGRTLGHFPGTVEEKLSPWLAPSLEVLQRAMQGGLFKYCIEKRVIQLQPLETIRGRSFEHSFIIVDEAQNLTIDEMISIVTRLGEGSKLVLMGDPFQTDLKEKNGLVWFRQFVEKYKLNIPCVEFELQDVVRSRMVKDILVALYTEFRDREK